MYWRVLFLVNYRHFKIDLPHNLSPDSYMWTLKSWRKFGPWAEIIVHRTWSFLVIDFSGNFYYLLLSMKAFLFFWTEPGPGYVLPPCTAQVNHDPTKVKAPSYSIGIPYKSKSSTMRFSLFTIIIIVPFCATSSKVIAWHISDLFGYQWIPQFPASVFLIWFIFVTLISLLINDSN